MPALWLAGLCGKGKLLLLEQGMLFLYVGGQQVLSLIHISVDEMTEIFGDTPVEMSFREVKEGMDSFFGLMLSLIHISLALPCGAWSTSWRGTAMTIPVPRAKEASS